MSFSEQQIKHMVDRFLSWTLPEDFCPDAGISFKAEFNEHTPWPMKHEPMGTNLFDYAQADAMIRHMIEGLPISSRDWAEDAAELDGPFEAHSPSVGEPGYRPAEMSARSPSDEGASAGNLTPDEPNYKALYTELKGETLEKVGPFAELASAMGVFNEVHPVTVMAGSDEFARRLIVGHFRALSTLYEKLSSIEVFPELPGGDVKNAAGEGEGSGAGEP